MSTKKENQYTRCNNTGPDFNIDAAIDGALSTWKGVCAGFSSGATKFNRSGECDQDYKNLATCSIQIDLTTDKDEWERITELPVGSTYGVTGKASGQKNRIMLNFTDILLDGGSNGSIRRWASPGGCSTLF